MIFSNGYRSTDTIIISTYNLLVNNEKMNQKDRTELTSVMIDYGKKIIQKMGCEKYQNIPGEYLEERPYVPGISYDQPSKDIQNGNLEKADTIEVALARRSQLLKEIGLEDNFTKEIEEWKGLNLEPQSSEETLEQIFPYDLEGLSTPLQVEGSHHVDHISTFEVEELPLDHPNCPQHLEIEIHEPNAISLDDDEMENLNHTDPYASYLNSNFSPTSTHVQNFITGETCIGKSLSFHPSHPSSPSNSPTSLNSYPYLEDYIHSIDLWIENACTCYYLAWYKFLIIFHEFYNFLDFVVSSPLPSTEHNGRLVNLFSMWLHYIFDFT